MPLPQGALAALAGLAAERFSEIHMEDFKTSCQMSQEVKPSNTWMTCCNPLRYDGFGSSSCFPIQGWHARRCCSLLEPKNFTHQMWTWLLRSGSSIAKRWKQPSGISNPTGFITAVYHKSGSTLAYSLLHGTKELSTLLVGRPDNDRSQWTRNLWTNTNPSFQRAVFVQQGQKHWMMYSVAPSEMQPLA